MNEIGILKESIDDIKELKKMVEKLKNDKKTLKEICEILNGHNFNGELFDVNYKNICVTIEEREKEIIVCQNIDVWNDKEHCQICESKSIEELIKIIERMESEK